MTTSINPKEAKAVGRRAVRIKQAVDKVQSRGTDADAQQDKDEFIENNGDTPYAQHALEDSEQSIIQSIEEKKLDTTVDESDDVIAKAETVFPFRLFPTIISIDRHKLTLVYRRFLGAHQTLSVPIENIKNIQANVGPVFGSLVVTSDQFANNTQEVDFLTKHDTVHMQRVVQGVMVATKEEIDISKIDTKKLREYLEKLGCSGSGR